MIKIDENKHEKIHTRQIKVTTYGTSEDAILVEGMLKDDRLQAVYRPTGENIPPDTVHHMIIRMKIRGPRLIIEDIDVDMPAVPHAECAETRNSLEPVIGMRIASGFTNNVKDLVGGARGCAHLVALLVSMASAAVQGAWTAFSRNPEQPPGYVAKAMNAIVDTCRVWRQDGPKLAEYRKRLKA
ncbi:MAG: DUF2889 domain-containing protein [Deltaproteobacteria bacterium]|nr:MAG: DUF2889 domain-containing protein [Deltaproteobacteria bacterium]